MKTFNIVGKPMLLSNQEVKDLVEDLQCYLDSLKQVEPSLYAMRVKFWEEEGYMGTDAECIRHYKDSYDRS